MRPPPCLLLKELLNDVSKCHKRFEVDVAMTHISLWKQNLRVRTSSKNVSANGNKAVCNMPRLHFIHFVPSASMLFFQGLAFWMPDSQGSSFFSILAALYVFLGR